MKYLRLLGVALVLFCISVKADAGIQVREKGSNGKFELVKEYKVTMPKYGKDTRGGRTGKDKKSGVVFAENTHVSREFIYPSNTVVAGDVFVARLYRVVSKFDQEDFEEFLALQNTDLIGLQTIVLKKEQDIKTKDPMQHMGEKTALWKNSKKDKGVPLMGCMVNEDIWFLAAVFDLDFSEVDAFLVFQKW